RPQHPQYAYLFNSYYNTVGAQFPRAERGLLTRPTVSEVWHYRDTIEQAVIALLELLPEEKLQDVSGVMELGLQHEQQHQEVMWSDINPLFARLPLAPVYRPGKLMTRPDRGGGANEASRWCEVDGGVCEIGHRGRGFAYDNESPRHRVFSDPFAIAER